MKEMKDDTMTQVQQLFSEYMKEVIMEMKGQLSGMVTEIVTTLVSPILQQNLIKTETRSRNRIGRDSNDNDISDGNGEEEYSEKWTIVILQEMKEFPLLRLDKKLIIKRKFTKLNSTRSPYLDKAKTQND